VLVNANMNQKTEIYENEDAARFLDYFITYKKLANKIETIKCIAALNSQITLNQNIPQPPNNPIQETLDTQPTLNPITSIQET